MGCPGWSGSTAANFTCSDLPWRCQILGANRFSPQTRPTSCLGEGGAWEGQQRCQKRPPHPSPGSGASGALDAAQTSDRQTLTFVLPMGLGRGQSPVLMALLLLLACLQTGMSLVSEGRGRAGGVGRGWCPPHFRLQDRAHLLQLPPESEFCLGAGSQVGQGRELTRTGHKADTCAPAPQDRGARNASSLSGLLIPPVS